MNPNAATPPYLVRHNRFVKTPAITDTLHLQLYQRGQWVRLAWCDHPSRYFGTNGRNVTAFHFPGAAQKFNSYCKAGEQKGVAA